MILTPNNGSVGMMTGNNAQCMAHISDVAIPTPSQFSFIFMRGAKIANLQYCCKFYQILDN